MTMMSLLKMATMLTITPVKKFATGQREKEGRGYYEKDQYWRPSCQSKLSIKKPAWAVEL